MHADRLWGQENILRLVIAKGKSTVAEIDVVNVIRGAGKAADTGLPYLWNGGAGLDVLPRRNPNRP
jgi:hypothetical protein